jgi:hypothetical protein
MDALRLPTTLERSQRVLVAGAGGGFDVYAGLPIYERLRALGKEVFLANLSFTYLGGTNAQQLTRALHLVEPGTTGGDGYFPERTLARFLSRRGESVCVYAFDKLGVAPVQEGYANLVRSLDLDAIVLVDGGTDILLRGDEQNLGTPEEDMTSLAAVAALAVISTTRRRGRAALPSWDHRSGLASSPGWNTRRRPRSVAFRRAPAATECAPESSDPALSASRRDAARR